MTDPGRHPSGRRVRRRLASLACLLVLGLLTACTGESPTDPTTRETTESEPAGLPERTEESTVTLEPRPTPARIRVTRVSGELKDADREVLAGRVGAVVTGYFQDAFLGGDYPRSDFGDAFATFTGGARAQARGDRQLLTNIRLGPTTEQVVARRQTAYLSVLAPYRVAAGVTARVDLRYLAVRAEDRVAQVRVHGRLLLTRDRTGGWAIFGYDLSRSARPAKNGS